MRRLIDEVFALLSTQKGDNTASKMFFADWPGEKEARITPAAIIPAPSEISTLLVMRTIVSAISGGKIETHVPTMMLTSLK